MKKLMSASVFLISCMIVFAMACGGSGGSGTPVEGGSCEGIGPTEGKIACDGQKIIACSSYTKYKWIKTQTCDEGKKCVVAADGKSASCE